MRRLFSATLQFDLTALLPRRDSFAISLSGTPVGWQRGVFEHTADGFRYTEDTQLAGVVDQSTVLEMDRSARMRSLKQTGKVQGEAVTIDVSYAGGRAKGSARTPDPKTGLLKSVTIDTILAEGTIDDNAIVALLPALRWMPGARWTMNVLSAGQAEIKPWTLSVAGTDSVNVGGQPAEAYRSELSGGDTPLVLWVSTGTPHRLLKLVVAGQPLQLLRVP